MAERYDAALAALRDGDLERVTELVGEAALPTGEPAQDPTAWRRIHSAHARLHAALAETLEDTRSELAKLRQGRRTLARMTPGARARAPGQRSTRS